MMNGESAIPPTPSDEPSEEEPFFNPQGVDDAGRLLQPEGQPEDLATEATGPEQEGERSLLATSAKNPGPAITRETIIARAETWLHPPVPYSKFPPYKDGYRRDCSGYVSMAWHTDSKLWWTRTLHEIGVPITYNDLRPGDMLLYHNRADPTNGSHVVLFDRWAGAIGGDFYIYEQTGTSNTLHRKWPDNARYSRSNYKPFRYVNVYVHGSYSGDSLADLLVLDPTTGVIRYFPNNGPGNWGAEANIGSGWNGFDPTCLYFADMTGDGRADLLALDPTTGVIRYFPNYGPGNWGAEAEIGWGWNGFDPKCLYFA